MFINDCKVITKSLADNVAIYATPSPTLPAVNTAVTNFEDGVAAAKDGGQSAMTARNNLRLILAALMRQLASYVLVACQGDMMKLQLSGFPVQKPTRSPIGVLPAPSNVALDLGARSGELDASVNPVFGASTYNWKLTANTPGATPLTAQSTASYFTFSGLTPGVTYTMSVYVVGAAGPSDWSQAVSQMAV